MTCHDRVRHVPTVTPGAFRAPRAVAAAPAAPIAKDQRSIKTMGLWPKGVPYPHDQQQERPC